MGGPATSGPLAPPSSSLSHTHHGHAHARAHSLRTRTAALARRVFGWLCGLACAIFSSDPSRFLPPRTHRHHHHSHLSSSAASASSHRNSNTSAVAASASKLTHAISPPSSPPPATASTGASSAVSSPASVPASAAPTAPASASASAPPNVFLSRLSFPLPSGSLPAARFLYVGDQEAWPWRLLAKLTLVASALYWGARNQQPIREQSAHAVNGNAVGSSNVSSSNGSSSSGGGGDAQSVLVRPRTLAIPSSLSSSSSDRHRKRWTLVLDLDETLVHTMTTKVPEYDCSVEIHTRRAKRVFYILKRPYLDTFLATLAQAYDIVIFTASIRRYADAVINLIDVHNVVSRRYFRPHCHKQGSSFLKDLRSLSSPAMPVDLRRTVLIDNSPVAYTLQEENGLPISTWTNDPHDTALRDLIPFLLALRAQDDVRPLLYRRHLLQCATEANLERSSARARDAPQIPDTSSLIEKDEEGDEEEEEDDDDDDDDDAEDPILARQRLRNDRSKRSSLSS